ncbi:hypothetical protein IE81DRAFT_75989 [Ceraceosorus guamensis]|uniref:CRAL-TRIO domain-containing protein n=1 Tax=Ceraceosorus guamensis TaxID=1522189 RepID=A0A316W103_9BASI|nr:hypothetical protein IE81DRAFT_75989 [Ceraceosorus guamensis]PWN43480.1 hypothetical protein IE81DRAFT_75989 [Ceraceosorus guamensis]
MSKVTEIGMAEVPLLEGYVGNLTTEQEDALKEMWLNFFKTCASAKGSASGDKPADGEAQDANWDEASGDPKKAGIPKGDAAKEEATKKEEEAAMNELLTKYGSEALRETFWKFVKIDNPDTAMLRFLRARKWDVSRATAMLAGCLKWRLDNAIEEYAENGDLGNGAKIDKYLEQHRSGKTYAVGTASNEMPIALINVAKHSIVGQPGATLQRFVSSTMEIWRLLLIPPNDKVVLIFNMTNFGLKNMDWNCILYIVKCLQSYYPESLGIVYVHNAPWIFWGIWKILGPLLDPVVRAKVAFTSKPEELEKHIPKERLLEEFGGTMKNVYTFPEPVEGENDNLKNESKRKETWGTYIGLADEYEKATTTWAKGDKDEKLVEKRKLLVKQLRVAQYEQEPYYRGKGVPHRDGTLDGQGIVTWEYPQKDGSTLRHIVGRQQCVATLKREIKEMQEGKSAADVEAKTAKAVNDSDWVTLYGDEQTARRIEGERLDGKVPPPGTKSVAPHQAGSVDAVLGAAPQGAPATGAADAAPAAPAAAAEAAAEPSENFKDAPQADAAATEKAVNGDKPAAAVEQSQASEPTATTPAAPNGAAPNGATADSAPKTNGTSVKAKVEEKSDYAKEDLKNKGETLGRRFSKLMGRK